MKSEIETLLERQARWQKARKDLSWPEKIRMAEQIRAAVEKWSARGRSAREAGVDRTNPR